MKQQEFIHTLPQILNKALRCSLLCGVLALFACSSDMEEPAPSPVDPDTPKETAYVSFNFDLEDKNQISTKGWTGIDTGTDSENFVNDVRIVLYDKDGKFKESFNYDIRSTGSTNCWTGTGLAPGEEANNKNKTQFKTVAKKVEKMDYQVLVIINRTNKDFSDRIENMTSSLAEHFSWNDIYKTPFPISQKNNAGGIAADKNFLMTNEKSLHSVSANDLYDNMNSAHNDPEKIKVSRVASKVTLTGNIATNSGAKVDNLTWELDVTNKYTYLVRHHAYWGADDPVLWYAEDPNFSGLAESGGIDGNFFFNTNKTVTGFSSSLDQSQYCLENTMSESKQKDSQVITRVIIRCRYKPANIPVLGQSYYVFNDQVYSLDNMKTYSLLVEDNHLNNDNELCNAIRAAKIEGYTFSKDNGYPYKGGRVDESFSTNSGIKYYYGGVSYYAIKVEHFGDKNINYGYYGILRNTHYYVKITQINGPGSLTLHSSDIRVRSGATSDTFDENALYNNISAEIIRE